MGYIKDEVAEDDQSVKGIIIAFEDDQQPEEELFGRPTVMAAFWESD